MHNCTSGAGDAVARAPLNVSWHGTATDAGSRKGWRACLRHDRLSWPAGSIRADFYGSNRAKMRVASDGQWCREARGGPFLATLGGVVPSNAADVPGNALDADAGASEGTGRQRSERLRAKRVTVIWKLIPRPNSRSRGAATQRRPGAKDLNVSTPSAPLRRRPLRTPGRHVKARVRQCRAVSEKSSGASMRCVTSAQLRNFCLSKRPKDSAPRMACAMEPGLSGM